jgi:hypothetical protein
LQKHPSSALLASAGLIPDAGTQPTSTMISLTSENSLPSSVAAALIQQHNQINQTNNPTPITSHQASTVNDSFQQQISASRVSF